MQEFRPMSIPDILDTTFRLYRDRFVTFLLIALVVYVPYSLLAALVLPAPRIIPVAPANQAAPQLDAGANLLGLSVMAVFFVILMPLYLTRPSVRHFRISES